MMVVALHIRKEKKKKRRKMKTCSNLIQARNQK
jgi:hypothetical protein